MKTYISVGLILFLTFCKNDLKKTAGSNSSTPSNEDYTSAISMADIEKLANECDYVDFLFYNMDISVSQNDKSSIVQTAHFLSTTSIPSTMDCPAIGRISFQSKGKITLEADIHAQGNCHYFTKIENKQPTGKIAMSPEGKNFLTTMINSYKK